MSGFGSETLTIHIPGARTSKFGMWRTSAAARRPARPTPAIGPVYRDGIAECTNWVVSALTG